MKKISAYLLAAALAGLSCHAAPPTQASIDKLLDASQVRKNLELQTASLGQIIRRQVDASMRGRELSTDDRKNIDAFQAKMAKLITDQLSWDKMKDLYEQVYGQTFTQDQVDALIAFYQGPVGKMYAEKQPEIAQTTTSLMQKRMIPVMMQLHGAVMELTNQMQEDHAAADEAAQNPPAAPAATPEAAAPKSN